MRIKLMLNLAALLFLSTVAHAADSPTTPLGDHKHSSHHPGMMQPAIDACLGKQVDDSVEFKNRKSQMIKGTCQLVAVPDHPSPPTE